MLRPEGSSSGGPPAPPRSPVTQEAPGLCRKLQLEGPEVSLPLVTPRKRGIRSAEACIPSSSRVGALLLGYGLDDTVSRMKTTVEIPDPLAEEAKAVARREKTTLRALIETGLRQVLRDRRRRSRFQLRDASFGGRGLQPHFREGDWQHIREAAYEGRGG